MQKIEDLEKKSSNNLKELTDKSKARKDKKKNLKNDLKKSQEDLENYKKELSTLKKKLQDSLLESQRNIEKIKLSEKNLEERTISLKKHMKLIDFLKDQNLESMEKHKRDNENLMDQVNKGFLEKDEEIRDLKRDKDKFRASNNTSQDVIRGLERENQNFKDDKLKMDNLFREKDKELHLKNQEYEKLLMKKKKYEDLEDKISEKDKEIERLMRKVKKLKDDDSSSEEKPAKEKKKSKQK
jgi:chromosome segregation ATPase